MRLVGKTAIVTGGASGIGAAIVRRFLAEGASVVIADRDERAGSALLAELETRETGAGPKGALSFATVDVIDQDEVIRLVRDCADRHGGPHVLVNSAGINVFHEPLSCTEDEWRRCMSIDLDGTWHCCRAVLPIMLAAGGGAIINIASTHAIRAMPTTFPYPVAKHAVLGLTRSLAVQYAASGVSINSISPGYIETPVNVEYFARFDDPAEAKKQAERTIPAGRLGRPDEIAALALLLASDEARFICGANLVIDGGASIRM